MNVFVESEADFFKNHTILGVYFYEDLWSKLTVCKS
jgi:hypothetical protein